MISNQGDKTPLQKSGNMATTNNEKEREDYSKIRKVNYRKNKETPDQAERRKYLNSIRSAKRRKKQKIKGENINQCIQQVHATPEKNQIKKEKNAKRMADLGKWLKHLNKLNKERKWK
jgi:hypothetical protein